jgi:SAM-dependent methyltransferase
VVFVKKESLKDHWLWKMNEENSQFFLKIIEQRLEESDVEVDALTRIFSRFKLAPSSTILDVFCLSGKHAVALAEKGYRVVGFDVSPTLIGQSTDLAKSRNLRNIEFIQGDIRHIMKIMKSYRQSFDAIIYMYGYIGCFGQETELKILRQLHALVHNGGFLVLEAYNRDYMVRNLQKATIRRVSPDLEYHVQRRLNLETSEMESIPRLYSKKGDDLHCEFSIEVRHRIYSLHELISLVKMTGWTYVESFGGFHIGQPTTGSDTIILVANA